MKYNKYTIITILCFLPFLLFAQIKEDPYKSYKRLDTTDRNYNKLFGWGIGYNYGSTNYNTTKDWNYHNYSMYFRYNGFITLKRMQDLPRHQFVWGWRAEGVFGHKGFKLFGEGEKLSFFDFGGHGEIDFGYSAYGITISAMVLTDYVFVNDNSLEGLPNAGKIYDYDYNMTRLLPKFSYVYSAVNHKEFSIEYIPDVSAVRYEISKSENLLDYASHTVRFYYSSPKRRGGFKRGYGLMFKYDNRKELDIETSDSSENGEQTFQQKMVFGAYMELTF